MASDGKPSDTATNIGKKSTQKVMMSQFVGYNASNSKDMLLL